MTALGELYKEMLENYYRDIEKTKSKIKKLEENLKI
jgi:hypothetical protein